MRLVAQIISIFGGIVGLFAALGALILGESAIPGDVDGRGTAAVIGLIALFVALTGIAGGVAIRERPALAIALQLVAAGAGFALLSWGWALTAIAFATGALLTILDDPDRRPRRLPAGPPAKPGPLGEWLRETLLQPGKRLGFGGGLVYVMVVCLLVYGSVLLLGNLAGLLD